MMKNYKEWINELKAYYLQGRVKAFVAVNSVLLEFYWRIGKDLSARSNENKYGTAFFETLSRDLCAELPDVKGLSPTNLKYTKYFYELYAKLFVNRPQLADDSSVAKKMQPNRPQVVDDLALEDIFRVPWGHHRTVIGKCNGDIQKAVFYVKAILANQWSRAVLLNYIDASLYEAKGKAVSNFSRLLPVPQGDLAQAITKDPYCFDFLSLSGDFTEKELQKSLVKNLTRFLMELGSGFSYIGTEYRLVVDGEEHFIDLLFYNTKIHAYVVIELKNVKFKPEHLGQLGFYVSAVNHKLKSDADNPTIGLLICKDKSNVTAQYALESSSEPIGISEYQLSKLYPKDFKSSLPSIREIEDKLMEEASE